jgi:three-Cys-motif partner protein
MELEWRTLKALADHKRGYRKAIKEKPEYKVEMWMLFPTSGIIRTLALDQAKVTAGDFARATRLYGSEEWKPIYELRKEEKLSAAEARDEYVNLMRWRLERALRYRAAHSFELRNSKGPLYHMIFATDNEVGTKIMSAIYANAAKQLPEMRQEARDRALGQGAFDLGEAHLASNEGYRYEPPWEPPGLPET